MQTYWFDILLQLNGTKQEKWHKGSDLLSSYWEYTNKLPIVTKISVIVDSLSCCSDNLLHSLHLLQQTNSHVKVNALCFVLFMSESVSWLNFSITSSNSGLVSRWETFVQLAVLFLQIQEKLKKQRARSEYLVSPPAGIEILLLYQLENTELKKQQIWSSGKLHSYKLLHI